MNNKKLPKFNNLFQYSGSKITMLSHLINDDILHYQGKVLVEPFMGSCSLLNNTDYEKYYFNELNEHIYFFLKELLVTDLDELEQAYIELQKPYYTGKSKCEIGKAYYYEVRNDYFKNYTNMSGFKRLSIMLFLIVNCFGAKPFNKHMSAGDTDRNKKFRKTIYKAFQAKKNKIYLYNMDYKDFINEVLKIENESDITLYFDPPYIDSFKYIKDQDLYEFPLKIKRYFDEYSFKNTILSNYNDEYIVDLYNNYDIIYIDRKLNLQSSNNRLKTELIIKK